MRQTTNLNWLAGFLNRQQYEDYEGCSHAALYHQVSSTAVRVADTVKDLLTGSDLTRAWQDPGGTAPELVSWKVAVRKNIKNIPKSVWELIIFRCNGVTYELWKWCNIASGICC